ncbi:MAG: hypothetical protein D6712_04730 [Chloroflexi bacterium]|nr:MAG: hypothetical protein D6712_04730 [Chloroflexota bacterium]
MLNRWFLGWSKVVIYVPSTKDVNVPLSKAEDVVNSTAKFLSQRFGGATSYPARGFWLSEESGLVKEDVTLVYTFARLRRKDRKEVIEFCLGLKAHLNQESILLEINGEPLFL